MTHEPIDDALKALRDELAGVAPSPEFASRVRERVAGELPLLREELAAVAPSPEFKVRVRQQIEAAGPARRAGWLSGRRWLVPSTLAAAALLAVVLAPRGPETPAPVISLTDLTPPPTILDGPPDGVLRPQRPASDTAGSGRRAPVRTSKAAPAEGPSLEVITNQPAILKAMWERIAPDAKVVESPATPLPETAPEIVAPPIEIEPIVVKPLAELPGVSGVLPIIRSITAQRAERSPK